MIVHNRDTFANPSNQAVEWEYFSCLAFGDGKGSPPQPWGQSQFVSDIEYAIDKSLLVYDHTYKIDFIRVMFFFWD